MKTRARWLRQSGAAAFLCAVLAVSVQSQPAPLTPLRDITDPADLELRLRNTIESLSALQSRAPGYPGAGASTEFVRNAFEAIGLENVGLQPFNVAVPLEDSASLTLLSNGASHIIHSFWPNHGATSHLPPEGLEAALLDAGNGQLGNLDGKETKDAVLLYDMDCGANWTRALSLGARAALFIEPELGNRKDLESKWISVPAHLPRFWIPRALGLELRDRLTREPDLRIRLNCSMRWKNAATANVWGMLPGKGVVEGEKKDKSKPDPVLVLTAFYDSNSAVPALAPGAESACGIATLLEIARELKQNPPSQRVVFIAVGGHFQALSGIGMALRAFDLANRDEKLPADLDPRGVESDRIKQFASPYFGFEKDMKTKPEVMCVGLDLTSHGQRILYGNRASYDIRGDIYRDRKYGGMGRRIGEIAQQACASLGENFKELFIDTTNPVEGRVESFFTEDIIFDPEVFTMAVPSIFFCTGNDSRLLVGTPHDRAEYVDFPNLARQARVLVNLIPRLTDHPRIWRDVEEDFSVRGIFYGKALEFDPKISVVPSLPVPDAIVYLRQSFGNKGMLLRSYGRPVYGVQMSAVAVADASGRFSFPWYMWPENVHLDSLRFNESGTITHAADLGGEGTSKYRFVDFHMNDKGGKETAVVLFQCVPTTFPDLIDPRYLLSFKFMALIDSEIGATPYFNGFILPLAERYDTSYVEPVLVSFTKPQVRLKLIMSLGLIGRNLIFINADEEEPTGKGIRTDKPQVVTHLPLRVAEDMWTLDEYRRNLWAKFGIINERLNNAHDEAHEGILRAKAALQDKQWSTVYREAHEAWASESRVYPDVAATANDIVRGVLFYLALAVPFAYCAERLLFCFSDLRRQIAGAFGIFIVVVIILGFVHPAFKITLTPFIIFLAFVIITLAAMVSILLISRFREEFRLMRGGLIAAYATDASPFGTLLVGVNLGIGMMRRRKARTILTVVTLIILTFAILSFTSVNAFIRFNEHQLPYPADYEGILYRNFDWSPLEEPEVRSLESAFQGNFVTARRAWYMSPRAEEQLALKVQIQEPVTAEGRQHPSGDLSAIVGLDPNEKYITRIGTALKDGQWLPEGRTDTCLVPSNLAKILGIHDSFRGKHLLVFGQPLEVVGLIDEEKWNAIRDLNDGPLTPVNTVQLRPVARDRLTQADPGDAAEAQFLYLEPSSVVITHHEWLMANGGAYRSLACTVNPEGEVDVESVVRDLMNRWSIAVYAGVGGKTFVYSSIGASSLGGLANLLVPILIGSLIILNALLGSVFEREKEIWTYSSLGVPQKMIGLLFMAEAGVYGILGSVLGYLVGQGVAKVITDFGLLQGLTLNYSSTSAFVSMALVIGVTLLSAVYPARKAYLSANPGFIGLLANVEPIDDVWHFDLPFVVHRSQALALNNFLMEYFDSHKEEAVGVFTTGDIAYSLDEVDGHDSYRLEFDCWLAPYDFGVSHRVTLWTTQDLEQDMMRYNMNLARLSGDIPSCRRANRGFLLALRKRFLVWRIMTDDDKETYRKMYAPHLANKRIP